MSLLNNPSSLKSRRVRKTRVAVGLSGGVDSSVTAKLLIDQGYDVIGVHMLTWDKNFYGCSSPEDRADALKIAKQLNIPFRTVDFRKEYKEKVIERFLSDYKKGFIPNPDIYCNQEIKFSLFLDYALNELSADKVATGHYARITNISNSGYQLLVALDKSKDQSYFLYRVGQYELSKTIFPLGELNKTQVRSLAKKFNLITANKADSTGVCFLGNLNLEDFLEEKIEIHSGNVLDLKGNVVGSHRGVEFYAIGQRHGFELFNYHQEPMFVLNKKIDTNEIVVGSDENLKLNSFQIGQLHWISPEQSNKLENLEDLTVRLRHLGELHPVEKIDYRNEILDISLEKSINFGLSKGQHAVLYLGEEVLGGGVVI